MTLEQIAERSGLATGTVQKYAAGTVKEPNINTLERIASALGVSFQEIFTPIPGDIFIVGSVIDAEIKKESLGSTTKGAYEAILPADEQSDSALIVCDGSLFPFAGADSMIVYRAYDYVHPLAIASTSVVELADGRCLIRHVLESKMAGHYIIQSIDRMSTEEAVLKSASPINEIRRRWK